MVSKLVVNGIEYDFEVGPDGSMTIDGVIVKKTKQADESKYWLSYCDEDGEDVVGYSSKEDLKNSIEEGCWDNYEFVDMPGLFAGQARIIKGTVIVPRITRRAIEVEID